jgi:hypothetical protein
LSDEEIAGVVVDRLEDFGAVVSISEEDQKDLDPDQIRITVTMCRDSLAK